MIQFLAQIAAKLGMNPKESERFIKFVIVGTVGFIVDFGALTLLVEKGGLNPVVANVFSFSAAVVSNFIFNRLWTYPESRSKSMWTQLGQFALVNVVGLLINTTLLKLLQTPFNHLFVWLDWTALFDRGYLPAKMGATVVVLFWNFFVNRYWTYNDVDKG